MANSCCYEMKVVGKTRESVERMLKILQYEDCEFYLYRVFDADAWEAERDSDLWIVDISGTVAWACSQWLHAVRSGDEAPNKNGAVLSILPEICRKLDIGVEVWADEPGVGFQQHILVDHSGEIVFDDQTEYSLVIDENGEIVDDGNGDWKKDGGFENYMEWSFANEIYRP